MRIHILSFLAGAALAASPAVAQPEEALVDTTLAPALLAQFLADARAEDDSDFLGLDSAAAPVRVYHRQDLNADGRDEVFLSATAQACGATGNCPLWIYQELPRGGWRKLFRGGGITINRLDTRTNGYRDLVTPQHFSASETYLTYDAFDGEQYVWTGTALEAYEEDDAPSPGVFEVRSPLPATAGAPRSIHLLPVLVDTARGIRVSAEYTSCGAERAEGCGEARMVLTGPGLGASRQCFTVHTAPAGEPLSQRGAPVCSERNARGAVLLPSLVQWGHIYRALTMELRSGALTLRFGKYHRDAFVAFWYGLAGVKKLEIPFPEP